MGLRDREGGVDAVCEIGDGGGRWEVEGVRGAVMGEGETDVIGHGCRCWQ